MGKETRKTIRNQIYEIIEGQLSLHPIKIEKKKKMKVEWQASNPCWRFATDHSVLGIGLSTENQHTEKKTHDRIHAHDKKAVDKTLKPSKQISPRISTQTHLRQYTNRKMERKTNVTQSKKKHTYSVDECKLV